MDPLSIAGIAFSAFALLRPVIDALASACIEGCSVHQTLDELRLDTIATSVLLNDISKTLNEPAFVRGIEDVQRGTRLLDGLERHLQSCHTEIENLGDLLGDLGLERSNSRFKQSILQFRLDQRMGDIIKVKQRFQHHNSSILAAMQLLQL